MPDNSEQPTTKKCRRTIDDAQKKELRDWAHDESNGNPSMKACIKWFEETHHRRLAASTVSEITSVKTNHYERIR